MGKKREDSLSKRTFCIDPEGLGRTEACFYLVDHKGSILYFNPAMERLFGYPPDEYLGKPISMLAPDPHEAHRRITHALDEGLGSWQGEITSRDRNGRVFPCQVTATRFLDTKRNEYVTLGIVRDDSSHRRTLDDLKSRNDLLGALASLAARMGIYTDTHRLAREALQAAADLTNVTSGSILLWDAQQMEMEIHETLNLPKNFFDRHRKIGWENMLEGQVLRDRVPILIPDLMKDPQVLETFGHGPALGAVKLQSLAMIPLMSQERPLGIMAVATNRPKVLHAQEMEFLVALGSLVGTYLENARLVLQLEDKNLALEKQNTELEELLSIMSHDLRSPLATIGGYASVMMKKGQKVTEEEQREYAGVIFRKTKETSQRMEDLLTLFRSSMKDRDMRPEPVDVELIIKQSLEESAPPRVRDRFSVQVPEKLPFLMGNPNHLTHIFLNLFSNSFKFIGRQETPVIRVGYEKLEERGRISHRFTISDNGMGIPEKYLPIIFRPFSRGPVDRSIPGSGMGLAVVEKLIRRNGGTIEVSSRLGEGTTFTFTLPWEEAHRATA